MELQVWRKTKVLANWIVIWVFSYTFFCSDLIIHLCLALFVSHIIIIVIKKGAVIVFRTQTCKTANFISIIFILFLIANFVQSAFFFDWHSYTFRNPRLRKLFNPTLRKGFNHKRETWKDKQLMGHLSSLSRQLNFQNITFENVYLLKLELCHKVSIWFTVVYPPMVHFCIQINSNKPSTCHQKICVGITFKVNFDCKCCWHVLFIGIFSW